MDDDLDFVCEIPLENLDQFSSAEESAHCFRWWITSRVSRTAFGPVCRIKLCAEPCEGCDGYSLLCDYRINFISPDADAVRFDLPELRIQFELVGKGASVWNEENDYILQLKMKKLQKIFNGETKIKIRTRLKVREMLTAVTDDYGTETFQRDFAILVESEAFYVNLKYLSSLGSTYFENMLESKNKGVTRTVLFSVTSKEFAEFLNALCTYRKPLITNRNFELVLNLSKHFYVEAALRACESFLMECDNIHIVRKLEYAAEFGLGLLGETLLRKLHDGALYANLDALHSYMQINDERLDQQHPEVLRALCVYDDFVIY